MKINIHSNFQKHKLNLNQFITDFNTAGILFGDGKRNKIKLFELDEKTINIKSFKIPNFYNKVIYKYFRKSKAKRSYEFAVKLLENKIGTPQPIAYSEEFSIFGLENSYYISEHLQADLTFRELVEMPDYPNNEIILRQFIQFSFQLHEKGIEFLDHSPGNTLIKKVGESKYDFFLVDLNRMNFHSKMSFDNRMKNLSRLTPKKEMIAIMSDEYAKLYLKSVEEVNDKMWYFTNKFQEKYWRKRRMKQKFLNKN